MPTCRFTDLDAGHLWQAIRVPAGFRANGRWPAGRQLIGRPRGDADLLRAAVAYEMLNVDLIARAP